MKEHEGRERNPKGDMQSIGEGGVPTLKRLTEVLDCAGLRACVSDGT